MDRRAFLATAAAVTAGCGRAGTDDTPTDATGAATGSDGTATPTVASTTTPTAPPASVAVTDLSVPSTVEIGTEGTLSVTLENSGGRSGSFTAAVEARVGTGEWASTDATVEASVPAGETVSETVALPPSGYVEPASYRLTDADPVARTRFVAREIAVGETHELPNGVVLSVSDVVVGEGYTYEGSDGETSADPPGGDKWAVGTVRAENVGDEAARAPLVSDFAFYRADEEYSYRHLGDNRDRYRGGELAPGEVSEGDLPTNVPVDAERGDLRGRYDETLDGGRVTVNWLLDE
ncbi:hypothetical protein C475_21914 [Halosimplex carlsbadense 2-9-1]|uniref:DUF4352 domain-containing protein n=1 Tax=Halosimplex carlsbadense 2-9-1 TaxID=797114 RepID=M0CDR7_9EURY|nr:hypothetical protein [Halosimplex carlsbadense]ELZ19999.1 hypothetical protein C475_21914 [Halosimplex carlsbadense 2-9-1]